MDIGYVVQFNERHKWCGCLGIIAEYLGQLFQEVKARPRYIVEKEIN